MCVRIRVKFDPTLFKEDHFNGSIWGMQGPIRLTETLFNAYPHLKADKEYWR